MTHLTKERLKLALDVALTAKQGGRTYMDAKSCRRITNTMVAALQTLIDAKTAPTGWKMVPIEPTAAMFDLSVEAIRETPWNRKHIANTVYKAMLAAAPTPPEIKE